MSRCGIYQIECLRTGQRYIGQTVDAKRRFMNHRWELNVGCHVNAALQDAWREHGEDNFGFSVIEDTTRDRKVMTERELHWFDHFRALNPDGVFNTRIPSKPAETPTSIKLLVSLTPELWERLKAIEEQTGARPSVTVRRLLEQSLRKGKSGPSKPAA
jgi:group I intron endonuclease